MAEESFNTVVGCFTLAFGGWAACKYVLGPTVTSLLKTFQQLSQEGSIVALASIDFLQDAVWPLTMIVLLPYLVKGAMAFWCLQSWTSQQKQIQDRVADEVKNVEQTRALMSSDYQGRSRYVEDQIQKHITEKVSEVRRIREKYEARRRAIQEECNVPRVQRQLASNPDMTLLQAFNLGRESGLLAGTKEQRLAREDEILKAEIEDAEEACKHLHENVGNSFERFERDQLQQRAQSEERLRALHDETTRLREQLPGHFRFIVGESARLCDQSLRDIQLTLTAGT